MTGILRSRAVTVAVTLTLAASTTLVNASAAAAVPARQPWRAPQLLDPVPTIEVVPTPPPDDVAARLAAKATRIPAPTWPTGAAEMAVAGAAAPATLAGVGANGLPVRVAAVPASDAQDRRVAPAAPSRVRVEVLDRSTTVRAGQSGLVLRVSRADGVAAAGRVALTVDYGQFAGAHGGDWARRLTAMALPECALDTPAAASCRAVPLPSRNETALHTVTTEVALPGASAAASPVLVALVAGASSTAGDYQASPLAPSARWTAGGATGDFAWSYPIGVPPSLGGPAPSLGLSYSSQSLDGLTSATNNQPSWVGDGFTHELGFIERGYRSCDDDGQAGKKDLCWSTDNATMTLSGHGGELIQYSTSPDLWRPVRDDGTRVERIRDTSKNNGDNDGEYWKVTTGDGTRYYFGLNRLTGWTAGNAETGSAFTTPVFGDDSGEPCNAAAWCQQAWRWNLDYVVDSDGNTMSLWYTRHTNNYARNGTATTVSSYVRAGNLARIDFGTDNRSGTDTTFSGTAPARVVYSTVDRCALASGCATHDAAHWPDVPWDRDCPSTTSCPNRYSPTFWSTVRLASVTTQVATGAQVWKDVDRWALAVQWLDPGIGDTSRVMWLSTVTRTGLNGTDPDVTLPAVTFGPTGTTMHNRVNTTDANGMFKRFRLATIANETGGVFGVTYSAPDCVTGTKMPTNPESNTYRCQPVYWTPPGGSQILDYFHKYVATSVTMADLVGGNPTQAISYAYPADTAFWHYADSVLTAPSKRTWSQWRGYDQVTVTKGSVEPGQPQLQSIIRYFRGKHGDKLPSGTRSQTYTVNGTVYNDENWLAGTAWQSTTRNGPAGATVSDTLTEPWSVGPTATRTVDGVTSVAYATRSLRTTTRTALDNGRPDQVTAVTNTYTNGADGTPPGRLLTVDEQGDVATTADDTCTRYTYARNDALYLHTLVSEVERDGLRCASAPTQAGDVLSIVRTLFDAGTSFPTTPTRGNPTRSEVLAEWNATPANRVFATASRAVYDGYGRVTESFDALDRKTTTAYTPSTGPVTAVTVTNPKLWTETSQLEPARGTPTRVTDINGRVTEIAYDALGRLTAVWLPGWDRAAHPGVASRAFTYTIRSSGGASAVATSVLNTAGTGYRTSYDLYDGFLRSRQTQQASFTGSGRILTDAFYDSRGLPVKSNDAYYTTGTAGTTLLLGADGSIPSQTRTGYDGAGRPTVSALVSQGDEQWRETTAYGGDRTDVTPADGGTATSTVVDAQGRRVELRQYHGATPTPFTAGSFDRTTYGYDRAGRQTSMVDPSGITWTWGFDQRGRLVSTTDPDKGAATSTFDAAGQRLTATDARGAVVSYTYDELGRTTSSWQGAVGTGTKMTEFTFDTPLKGLPTTSTRWVAGQAYTTTMTAYDTANRPTGTTVTVPASVTGLAGSYAFTTSYHPNGSVATVGVPAAGGLPAETLTFSYTSRGMPRGLSGTTPYVSDTTYLQTGQITSVTNNTTTAFRSFTYDPVTGRRSGYAVQAASTPDVLADVRLSYSEVGDVTEVKNLVEQYGYGSDDTQCFGYDNLRRLTRGWTPDSNDCADTPSTSGLGGPAPYWLDWSYDAAGNRTGQTAHTASGTETTTYAYPAPSAARPHAVTATSGAVSGSYGYDAVGNTTSRPGSSGQQTLTWDAEGRLATVTESGASSTYVYDAKGNRLLTTDALGTTLHLPHGMDIHVNPTGGGAAGVRRYQHAGLDVAVRAGAANLSWVFDDPQGTGTVSVRDSDLTVARRYHSPYGVERGTPSSWPSQHGYVDGYNESVGLVHLGARDYDPELGRFLNLDPIVKTGDPQQMHGYSYANNNPTTLSDPNGTEPGSWCNPGTGCAAANVRTQTAHPMMRRPAPFNLLDYGIIKNDDAVDATTKSREDRIQTQLALLRQMIDQVNDNGRPADYVVMETTVKIPGSLFGGPPINGFGGSGDKSTTVLNPQPSGGLRINNFFGCIFSGGFLIPCMLGGSSSAGSSGNQWGGNTGGGTKVTAQQRTYGDKAMLKNWGYDDQYVTTGIILTRGGHAFAYVAGVVPEPQGPSVSYRWGFLNVAGTPTEQQIVDFSKDWSVSVGVSAGISTAFTSSLPFQGGTTAKEIGFSTDVGLSISVSYSWQIL
jgi:RHS repeat-associated protein